MDSWSNRPTLPAAEQHLYNYLLHCVENQPIDETIHCFHQLFIEASGASDPSTWRSIDTLVTSASAEQEFKFVLNRSCHILINHWLMQPRLHPHILELITLLETPPSSSARTRTSQRLRVLVQRFLETEQYLSLKRLKQVMATSSPSPSTTEVPLGDLIQRYPCLYEYSLLTEDSTEEQRQRIAQLRSRTQHQFELDLSRYIAHQQRLRLRNTRTDSSLHHSQPLPQREAAFKNPTLLSDRQLDEALQQFAGKVDGSNTHRDLASQFLTYGRQARSFRIFKDELYEYIITSVDARYGKHRFNQQLYHLLSNTLTHCDDHQVSDFLLVETCKKLLDFLVVGSAQNPNHSRFVDLIGNTGIILTISLLLKIVLLCRAVKPWLEKRFAVLFKLHETNTIGQVSWLVDALEHLNVALSTNFGTVTV